jgi:hypothetical protein
MQWIVLDTPFIRMNQRFASIFSRYKKPGAVAGGNHQ